MKIEIGESICYSYLRHVKQCWVAQTNWKVSDHWAKYKTDDEMAAMFLSMKERFDRDGKVFKKTKGAAQFLTQGEIDVVGVDQEGGVHAMEVAFHERGLNYGGGPDNRVLKKLLRTVLILKAYQPPRTKFNIYFVSPKVNPSVQQPMTDIFAALRSEYPDIAWNLFLNEDFTEQVLRPTLGKASTVADTSELFVRSWKLFEMARLSDTQTVRAKPAKGDKFGDASKSFERNTDVLDAHNRKTRVGIAGSRRGELQPIVRNLMITLLEDYPSLLDDAGRRNLMDSDYCKDDLGLRISNLSFLRRVESGREISGHARYWERPYGGQFYVCSQWGKDYHVDNARSLLSFVTGLTQRNLDHPDVSALERHERALRNYIEQPVAGHAFFQRNRGGHLAAPVFGAVRWCDWGYSSRGRKGTTPGAHHFSQLSSTRSWKNFMSSWVKWAKRPWRDR